VLANLVSNALKFTAPGGHVLLGGERRGAVIRLDVSDDGAGIPASLHEAAFERFRQVHEHDRRGLGLGLYISRSLVEAHGGRIWVESAPGAGSTFHVELPA
jgi:signal transduction histidine kinase